MKKWDPIDEHLGAEPSRLQDSRGGTLYPSRAARAGSVLLPYFVGQLTLWGNQRGRVGNVFCDRRGKCRWDSWSEVQIESRGLIGPIADSLSSVWKDDTTVHVPVSKHLSNGRIPHGEISATAGCSHRVIHTRVGGCPPASGRPPFMHREPTSSPRDFNVSHFTFLNPGHCLRRGLSCSLCSAPITAFVPSPGFCADSCCPPNIHCRVNSRANVG